MKAMETVKSELAVQGVDFVYITDESSPVAQWKETTAHHAGDHYRISAAEQAEMNIPGYTGSIPLLLYDRKGRFVRSFVGWGEGSLSSVRAAVEEVL